ncbi:MAG TPA: SMC-Scp complex subunit ScpB [Gemmatimonadaceae bacterium]|nr:SMC-Scp complex subunit ScpB [Gemmatimonadaceae bacterium]
MIQLAKLLEAALFSSAHPVAASDLKAMAADGETTEADVTAALEELRRHYDEDGHGVELIEVSGGWQILTRPEFTETIERAQLAARPQRLSAAALETLAIVAYRQPIGRAEIEEIRGVGAGQMLKSLHERELIEVVGRGEGMGRPLLYGTTPGFLEQFALRHLGELPRADELAVALRDPNAPPAPTLLSPDVEEVDATAKPAAVPVPAEASPESAEASAPEAATDTQNSDSPYASVEG